MESIWFDLHPDLEAPTAVPVEGEHADTVVVGAGITGLTTALLLARSGQSVLVLEDRHIGAVTTGHTTAKVSILQGNVYAEILKHHSHDVLNAYVEGNREGQAWLTRLLDDHAVPYEKRTAWTYATTQCGYADLRKEFEACRSVDIDVQWSTDTELPFRVEGALMLPDQAQIDPLAVLDLLRRELIDHGGRVVEGTRVTDATSGSPVTVTTTRGKLTADRVVLATGTPILDRGGYFAKLVPQRSYATTYRLPGDSVPQGMYLSIDQPTRSLRSVATPDGELLMVGGNGHITGRADSEAAAVTDLEDWTRNQFPGAERTHAWSAQDYQSINRVPFVGLLPRGGKTIYVATGYNKWGMTNGVAAALNLSGQILGGSMGWADTLGRRVTKPAGVLSAIKENAGVAGEMVKDWVSAGLTPISDDAPAEGKAAVGRGDGGRPVGVSTVGGHSCKVSAICTHMGGVLRWNDAEETWDCPLHGSRFGSDGTRLEGPAVADLEQLS